jgi:plasmid stabilization system protein ParE
MTACRLHYLDEARRELGEAFDWYAARSRRAAAALLREIEQAAADIVESPDRWPYLRSDVRRYVLRRFPYSLLYRQVQDSIQIIAVAHHKRRPGYWVGR